MFLDKLYLQYQRKNKPVFGSRFMDLLGHWFIGSPEKLWTEEWRPDVKQSFFFIAPDRIPPEDDEQFKEWELQQIRATQYREPNRPKVAKASFLAAVVMVLVIGAGIGGVVATKFGFAKAKGAFTSMTSEGSSQSSPGAPTLAQCNEYNAQFRAGKLTADMLPIATVEACQKLIGGAQ